MNTSTLVGKCSWTNGYVNVRQSGVSMDGSLGADQGAAPGTATGGGLHLAGELRLQPADLSPCEATDVVRTSDVSLTWANNAIEQYETIRAKFHQNAANPEQWAGKIHFTFLFCERICVL